MYGNPSEEVFIVKTIHEWPLYVYANEGHAIDQYERLLKKCNGERHRVKLWKARITDVQEFMLTDPVPPKLVPASQ